MHSCHESRHPTSGSSCMRLMHSCHESRHPISGSSCTAQLPGTKLSPSLPPPTHPPIQCAGVTGLLPPLTRTPTRTNRRQVCYRAAAAPPPLPQVRVKRTNTLPSFDFAYTDPKKDFDVSSWMERAGVVEGGITKVCVWVVRGDHNGVGMRGSRVVRGRESATHHRCIHAPTHPPQITTHMHTRSHTHTVYMHTHAHPFTTYMLHAYTSCVRACVHPPTHPLTYALVHACACLHVWLHSPDLLQDLQGEVHPAAWQAWPVCGCRQQLWLVCHLGRSHGMPVSAGGSGHGMQVGVGGEGLCTYEHTPPASAQAHL